MSSPGRFCAEKQLRFEPLLAQGRGQRQIHCGRQVTELPGLRLWIVLCEMGEKGAVSKGKHAGGVVGHAVGSAGDMVIKGVITMEPLVQTVDAKEVGRGRVRGDGPFAAADDGGKVVVEYRDGVFADVGEGGEDVLVRQDAGEL